MGCNGACAVSPSGSTKVARLDGHCCEECAAAARAKLGRRVGPLLIGRAARARVLLVKPSGAASAERPRVTAGDQPEPEPTNPRVARLAPGLRQRVTGMAKVDAQAAAARGRQIVFVNQRRSVRVALPRLPLKVAQTLAVSRAPVAPQPRHARIGVAEFLALQGVTWSQWKRASHDSKVMLVQDVERLNPGMIGDSSSFVAMVDSRAPSGDISIPSGLGPGDWVSYGTTVAGTARDDLGNTVSIDSNGHPIQGTATGSDGTPINDSDIDTASLGFVSGSDARSSGGSTAGGLTDEQARQIFGTVNTLIGAVGVDIQTALTQQGSTDRARIMADLQTALHSQRDVNGNQLTPAQIAQMQQLYAHMNPPPPSFFSSTPAKIGMAAVALGVIGKLAGVI